MKTKYLILVATMIIAGVVTADGFRILAMGFAGVKLSLWKAWILGLSISFLRNRPFSKDKDIGGMDINEVLSACMVAVFFDCLAVYWLIPYVVSNIK